MSDPRYFHGYIEGEAPPDYTPSDIREELDEALPGWASIDISRVDEADD